MLSKETKQLIVDAISFGSLVRVDQILHDPSKILAESLSQPSQVEGLLAAAEILAGIRGEIHPVISTEEIEVVRRGFERTSSNLEENAMAVTQLIVDSPVTSMEAKSWANSLICRLKKVLNTRRITESGE